MARCLFVVLSTTPIGNVSRLSPLPDGGLLRNRLFDESCLLRLHFMADSLFFRRRRFASLFFSLLLQLCCGVFGRFPFFAHSAAVFHSGAVTQELAKSAAANVSLPRFLTGVCLFSWPILFALSSYGVDVRGISTSVADASSVVAGETSLSFFPRPPIHLPSGPWGRERGLGEAGTEEEEEALP